MQHGSVDWKIVETTRSIVGKALSSPDFRRSAAFTARYRAGSEPRLSSGLLQHRDKEIVEESYNLSVAQKWLTCSAGGSTTLQDPDVRGGKVDPLLSPGVPLSPASGPESAQSGASIQGCGIRSSPISDVFCAHGS